MSDKKSDKNDKIIKYAQIVGIIAVFILIIGASYSLYSLVKISKNTNTLKVGDITLNIKDGNIINVVNAYPMTLNEALNDKDNHTYDFTLTNSNQFNLDYKVYLTDVDFDDNDKCKTVTWKNADESTVGEVPCSNDLRMNNNIIALKAIKKVSASNDYQTVQTNDIKFVGQLDGTDGKNISDYTLLSNLEATAKGLLLDEDHITKKTSIDYKLTLWIPYPIEYNNDDSTKVPTTTTKTSEGYTVYTAHKYKAKIRIDAVQNDK